MCDAGDSGSLWEHKDSHPSRVSFLFCIWDQNPNVLDQNRFVNSIISFNPEVQRPTIYMYLNFVSKFVYGFSHLVITKNVLSLLVLQVQFVQVSVCGVFSLGQKEFSWWIINTSSECDCKESSLFLLQLHQCHCGLHHWNKIFMRIFSDVCLNDAPQSLDIKSMVALQTQAAFFSLFRAVLWSRALTLLAIMRLFVSCRTQRSVLWSSNQQRPSPV